MTADVPVLRSAAALRRPPRSAAESLPRTKEPSPPRHGQVRLLVPARPSAASPLACSEQLVVSTRRRRSNPSPPLSASPLACSQRLAVSTRRRRSSASPPFAASPLAPSSSRLAGAARVQPGPFFPVWSRTHALTSRSTRVPPYGPCRNWATRGPVWVRAVEPTKRRHFMANPLASLGQQ